MDSASPIIKKILPFVSVAGVSLLVLGLVYLSVFRPFGKGSFFGSDVSGSANTIFSSLYPASDRFRDELERLRTSGKLKQEDELLIQRSVAAVGQSLKMPPAVLWCLLFQESRLNHLEGIDDNRGALGLGQFSHFSFYEVNHHLDRYGKDNYTMFTELLGSDVRPVEPRASDLVHPSSYYSIPTAVVSTAAYLNNRFLQLERILNRQGFPYSRDILWLHAAMAYNKGTRTVLALWSNSRKRFGARSLERLVLESETLFRQVDDTAFLSQSLKTIWPHSQALQYARELRTHMANMKECTLASAPTAPMPPTPEIQ